MIQYLFTHDLIQGMHVDATNVSFYQKTVHITVYDRPYTLCYYIYIYTHIFSMYIYIQTITYIYLHHTHSLPFFCVISHVYIVVHFYYAFFCVFYRYIMAPWHIRSGPISWTPRWSSWVWWTLASAFRRMVVDL